MGLDVYFRRDIANVLRAVARAMGGALKLSYELLDGVTEKEQERLIKAYRAGAQDALSAIGHSFGLEPVHPAGQIKDQQPQLAGLLWAESSYDG